ncbi:MAG: thiamine phosphate synthase [Phenylobacterium sp.]|uniref:thiamine phosphate synthase n=1 Tax=Phenylobacterium sp. TaxID=1871053 RepID=UPI00391BA3F6
MRKPLPALLAFTDPVRTPDPTALARRLPRGTGLVYRAFGAPEAAATAQELARIARERGLLLLIGADAELAARVRAHGVHLPERLARLAKPLKRRGFLVTAAAHSPRAARIALAAGADAAVVSAVFPSKSPSAGPPIGPLRLARLVRTTGGPVYGLGGIGHENARQLLRTGLVGLAAVAAFRT